MPKFAVHQLAMMAYNSHPTPPSFIEQHYHNILQTFPLVLALIKRLEFGINQIIGEYVLLPHFC